MGGIIEGIGDEVVHFFIGLSLILVVTIAWATTNIRHQWNMRVVYLLDRGGRIRASHTLSNHMESATISEGTDPGEVGRTAPTVTEEILRPLEPPEPVESSGDDEEEEEISEIVQAMDSASAPGGVVTRQLTFLENIGVYRRSRQQAVEAAPAEVAPEPRAQAPAEEPTQPQQQQDITIKLKYINDDLKIVNGRLGELLGDFKRRHFEDELSDNKLVRLIFNGQVLQRDTDTLQSYGMFDNCVVHCLVYQQRSSPASEGASHEDASSNNNNNQREWDLGNLFIATVSFSLGTAWYFRYQYPQLFTVTATVGLVTITGVFTVLSISSYFPDTVPPLQQDQQPQPVPHD